MSVTLAIFSSLGVCIVGAILEGLAAGNNIKPFFAKLRFPAYSAPLWAWYIIGALYYAICFVILYRLFRYNGDTPLLNAAFALILIVMATNALWNYIFFRAQNLFGAFLLGFPYALVAIALFVCLRQFDKVAAWAFVPYLIYLTYAAWWSYGLLKLNSPPES
ncbi:MAG: tryptophan-rich sensory protein [Pyrinomonadaceae bacterium]|nr:tryptophan-rich sensory protein [Pyrinomonadaceae bacterium]